MSEGNRRPKFNARIEPALRDRLKAEAERRFQGNEAMAAREAIVTYLDLRDSLGFEFERTIDSLRSGDREAIPA